MSDTQLPPARVGESGARKWNDPDLEYSGYDDDGLKALKSRLCNIYAQIEQAEKFKVEMRKIVAAIKAYKVTE